VAAAAHRFGIAYGGPGTQEPAEVGVDVPRPPYWGGFRLDVEAIELWVEGEFRIHDRARWTRDRRAAPPQTAAAAAPPALLWTATRLQP
jgi:pyridoxamine 5'-phosphate oxidase